MLCLLMAMAVNIWLCNLVGAGLDFLLCGWYSIADGVSNRWEANVRFVSTHFRAKVRHDNLQKGHLLVPRDQFVVLG